jgi:hypothetical protein
MIAYVRGEGERDYKTILQELASAEVRSVPEYRIRERGPDHQKEFTATGVRRRHGVRAPASDARRRRRSNRPRIRPTSVCRSAPSRQGRGRPR